jgi:hypothetical protein
MKIFRYDEQWPALHAEGLIHWIPVITARWHSD